MTMYQHAEESEYHKFLPQFPEELEQDISRSMLSAAGEEAEGVITFPKCISQTLSHRLSMSDYSESASVLGDELTVSKDSETWYCNTEGVYLSMVTH